MLKVILHIVLSCFKEAISCRPAWHANSLYKIKFYKMKKLITYAAYGRADGEPLQCRNNASVCINAAIGLTHTHSAFLNNGPGFMVSADWISWVTVTTLIIRAIHLMEWKAVLSRNAFLPSKFPICMQLLFRITVLSTVSHIEILSRLFIEEVQEGEKERRREKEKDM